MSSSKHRRLNGAARLLRTMTKNRRALIGLILLIGSVFVAVAAPLLTPYDPKSSIVAGARAAPGWMRYFPDGYYLSGNVIAVQDPLFNSPQALQGWTVNASSTAMSNTIVSYASGVSSVNRTSKGSLQVNYGGTSADTVTLYKTFNYPYNGPPDNFIASVAILASGASALNPVNVKVFIDRVGDQSFNLWDQNITESGVWLVPQPALDSRVTQLQQHLHVGSTTFGPAQVIFSSIQEYSYGFQLTFTGPATVNLDNTQLLLLGTAFGIMGTDNQGTDLFTQLLYGARISLFVGLLSAGIGIGLGLIIGLIAGFIGGVGDEVLMRFTDMMLVIPTLPLLLVLITVLGASLINIIIIIGFLGWMGFARIVRSQVLTLKERPFVEAAKAVGAGRWRIISKHVFPNIVSLTYVNLALTVPAAILTESALEFLGLGDPSVVSWGNMFQHAEISGSLSIWWWVLPPGIAIALVSLSFVLIGYALDEIFNPRLRVRR
jgi:peptide/nickel transport system permease protein